MSGLEGMFDGPGEEAVAEYKLDAGQARDLALVLGERYSEIDFAGTNPDKAVMLKRIAAALDFPETFGHNLDALYDALTDLPPGRLIVLRGLPDSPPATAILDVFREAADFLAGQGGSLRVLYSWHDRQG